MGKKSVAEIAEISEKLSEWGPGGDSIARADDFASGSFSLALLIPFETCAIPKQIAKRLRAAGVHDVLDLLGMDVHAIRIRAKLGPVELQILQARLVDCRLRLGSRPPSWITEHLKECRSAFKEDIDRIMGAKAGALSKRVDVQLAPSLPTCLEEELEGLISSRIREKRLPIVRRVLGWDGGVGTTLETAGHEFGLTRERIRQIVSSSLPSWQVPATSFSRPRNRRYWS